ncbi:LytR/AlgR family response regulator transcription factor [Dyadobacter arcticus]|uniref:DNA-binding LytR/AlgR family response regulator n=1 Tax=Dyadobacter arcticus TaxID=1078754 RepID=A0ABX0UI51_9BACT|nr:LytTR family DNA-binding domain-containing protein [Dyadobacter arcticus]NIJ52703.1 DNA-binding LytR/AlgR family response regulator [Dyadobacter arcticus]
MKLRCLIVDDEPPASDVLELYIESVEGLALAARCENAVQAFQVLQQQPIDLMFLDITMPKLIGTDFLRTLRNPPPVIITTAYREYALDGYELDVLDYLLKPIPFDRFLRAVGKVLKTTDNPVLAPLPEKAPVRYTEAGFLFFRADRKLVKVLTSDILYIESLKDYIQIITIGSKPLVVKQTMSAVEAMLPTDQFVRVHRSYIAAISRVTTYTPRHIDVAGQELPIGRLYQKEVERILHVSW